MNENEIINELNFRIDNFSKDVIALINRKNEEIEQWKQEAIRYQNLWCMAFDDIRTAKSEAIKEFAERLKGKCYEDFQETYEMLSPYVTDDDIDNLVKEMTEVETNQRKEDEGK